VNAITVENLRCDYGDRRALDGVSFDVRAGEIFGLLGPNGGGKTTLFRVLTTLMAPTKGRATVLGHDTQTETAAVRRSIGVVFQSPSLDNKLTALENLKYHGHLYGLKGAELNKRMEEMLARVGLSDRGRELVETFSGGLRRRVELAKGLLHSPKVLLLDEPSGALDPGARRDLWLHLEELRQNDGVTSFVTTHLMEEAERCDRVAILDRGQLVGIGTPAELKAEVGGDVITVGCSEPERLAAELRERFSLEPQVLDKSVRFERNDGAAFVPEFMKVLGDRVETIALGKPTLQDVFIKRTGHRFWTDEDAGA